jgi:prepilin-type N-terminal cleavage/methylation domain-containing protein
MKLPRLKELRKKTRDLKKEIVGGWQVGFTMIELLVVIAVIAVLAVAVLSSINPIEQINKGRDTRTRSDAAQTINAADRFFASHEKYPWNDTNYACGSGVTCSPVLSPAQQLPAAEFPFTVANAVCTAESAAPGEGLCMLDSSGGAWMDGLTDTAEVKGQFVSRVQGQTTYALYAYKDTGAAETLYICFKPSSKAFQDEALGNCQDSNVAGQWSAILKTGACPGTGTVGTSSYVQSTNKDELICLP